MNEINKSLLNFIAETGMLKNVKRSGWWVLGMPFEESVAEHSFRCTVLAYLLSKMENVDPYKAMLMSLFADLPEARINDYHKVAGNYLDFKSAEKKVFSEQTENLPEPIKDELFPSKDEYDEQASPESIIARDADILECLIQAKEYCDKGYKNASKFLTKGPGLLRTRSARKLWEDTKSWNCDDWWQEISRFER